MKQGTVFSLVQENEPLEGCTISKEILNPSIMLMSMGAQTDISAESYAQSKLVWLLAGSMKVMPDLCLEAGQAVWTHADALVGMKTEKGAIYLEMTPERSNTMKLTAGEVFRLQDLIDYRPGAIVNRDVFSTPAMKLVVMAFDEDTGLGEHAAPGEAMLFGLEGEAVITYEGTEHVLKAGEQFLFAKNGKHAVRAKGRFKMALLMTLA